MLIYTDTRYKPRRKSKKTFSNVAQKYRPEKSRTSYNPNYDLSNRTDHIPSLMTASPIDNPVKIPLHKMSDEMREREITAREESNRRKKMVTIQYNKGAYQYAPELDPKLIGRK